MITLPVPCRAHSTHAFGPEAQQTIPACRHPASERPFEDWNPQPLPDTRAWHSVGAASLAVPIGSDTTQRTGAGALAAGRQPLAHAHSPAQRFRRGARHPRRLADVHQSVVHDRNMTRHRQARITAYAATPPSVPGGVNKPDGDGQYLAVPQAG